jgi:hypothetical protein
VTVKPRPASGRRVESPIDVTPIHGETRAVSFKLNWAGPSWTRSQHHRDSDSDCQWQSGANFFLDRRTGTDGATPLPVAHSGIVLQLRLQTAAVAVTILVLVRIQCASGVCVLVPLLSSLVTQSRDGGTPSRSSYNYAYTSKVTSGS